MDARYLVLLPFNQTSEKGWAKSQLDIWASNCVSKNVLQNRVRLHNIKLTAVQVLGCRFGQSCLEELDRRCDSEEDCEMDTVPP